MSNTKMYRQCLLKKKNSYRVGWIPDIYAIKGKYLKIKFETEWDNGWQVVQVGILHDAAEVEEGERAYTHQRKASDI